MNIVGKLDVPQYFKEQHFCAAFLLFTYLECVSDERPGNTRAWLSGSFSHILHMALTCYDVIVLEARKNLDWRELFVRLDCACHGLRQSVRSTARSQARSATCIPLAIILSTILLSSSPFFISFTNFSVTALSQLSRPKYLLLQ